MKRPNSEKQTKSKARNLNNQAFFISYPKRLVAPIASFLSDQLSRLERRQQEISKEDPFQDSRRLNDKASLDSDAAEQFGHARVSAIKAELDRRIIQTRKALTQIKVGKYGICESCQEMIDTDRLMVYPDATLCFKCEKRREK